MTFEYAHISVDLLNGGVVENTTGSTPDPYPPVAANNAGADHWEAFGTSVINDGSVLVISFKRITGP